MNVAEMVYKANIFAQGPMEMDQLPFSFKQRKFVYGINSIKNEKLECNGKLPYIQKDAQRIRTAFLLARDTIHAYIHMNTHSFTGNGSKSKSLAKPNERGKN